MLYCVHKLSTQNTLCFFFFNIFLSGADKLHVPMCLCLLMCLCCLCFYESTPQRNKKKKKKRSQIVNERQWGALTMFDKTWGSK